MNNITTTLYIVRHGETEWNVERRIQGHLNSTLTPNGVKQVQETAEKLKDIHFDAIFSSDLLRAQQTAKILKLNRELEVITKKTLRERSFGTADGKLGEEYRNEIKDLLEQYKTLSDSEKLKFKFTKGYESDEELISRLITFLREIGVAYSQKTVLIVTHGGIIRTFLTHVGFATLNDLRVGTFKNGGYVKVTSDGVDFFVEEVQGYEQK